MPTVTTRYVTWNRAGGRRLHTGPAAATDLADPIVNFHEPSTPFQGVAPSTWGGNVFAFWAITGGADGNDVQLTTTIAFALGTTTATATAWYLPAGGPGGPGGPVLLLDAFDVNLGWWADDDFVTVTSDPGLSANANEYGVVPLDQAQDVHAFDGIHSVPFSEWTVISGNAAVNDQDLNGAAGAYALAFAFYKSGAPIVIDNVRVPELGVWASHGVMVDGGGPTGGGPVGPWDPTKIAGILAGVNLAESVGQFQGALRDQVLEVAAEQVMASARTLSKQMTNGQH